LKADVAVRPPKTLEEQGAVGRTKRGCLCLLALVFLRRLQRL
jgi:hypothetical protein